MREVALMPGGIPSIFNIPQWLPIVQNQSSHELWIDYWAYQVRPDTRQEGYTKKTLKRYIKTYAIQKLIFYDIFHYESAFEFERNEMVQYFQKILPTSLVTFRKHPIPELNHVVHFDFYWNRCKQAYNDKIPGWKQLGKENFNQWPIILDKRPLRVLSLYGSNKQHIKRHLYNAINHVPGYHSGLTKETVLPCETGETHVVSLAATPPARKFFDDTYVSAQMESMIKGNNVIFCEKTYDHLIQGRFVLNFGPRYYYRTLAKNGWKIPVGIDFSWDNIEDQNKGDDDLHNEPRFVKYIECLIKLTSDVDALHDLFIANIDVFKHNQQQLQKRPYDIFNLEQLDHK
jgi:hypothetical protein